MNLSYKKLKTMKNSARSAAILGFKQIAYSSEFILDSKYKAKKNIINRGELGIQGSSPAEIIKLWLGLRFLGNSGIYHILKSSIEKKLYFEENLNHRKFSIYSGPLHIISFLPKGLKEFDGFEPDGGVWGKVGCVIPVIVFDQFFFINP